MEMRCVKFKSAPLMLHLAEVHAIRIISRDLSTKSLEGAPDLA